MTPLFVVPGKAVLQLFGWFSAAFVRVQLNLPVLVRYPEPFAETAVFEVSFIVNADFHVPGFGIEAKA